MFKVRDISNFYFLTQLFQQSEYLSHKFLINLLIFVGTFFINDLSVLWLYYIFYLHKQIFDFAFVLDFQEFHTNSFESYFDQRINSSNIFKTSLVNTGSAAWSTATTLGLTCGLFLRRWWWRWLRSRILKLWSVFAFQAFGLTRLLFDIVHYSILTFFFSQYAETVSAMRNKLMK